LVHAISELLNSGLVESCAKAAGATKVQSVKREISARFMRVPLEAILS
jgi:hypothetical protein